MRTPVIEGKTKMNHEINELTELAYDGGAALTTTPVVGTPTSEPAANDTVGGGSVPDGAIRVTILGSGDPFVNRSQGSASVLIRSATSTATSSSSTWVPARWPTSTACTCRSPARPGSS